MTREIRAQLRRLLAAATARPWTAIHDTIISTDPAAIEIAPDDAHVAYYGGFCIAESMRAANRDLAASAVNYLEELVDDADELEDEVESQRIELEALRAELRRAPAVGREGDFK